jgi:integrase
MGSEPAKVMPRTQKSLNVNPILKCGLILEKLGRDILSPENPQPASDRNTNYRDRLTAETSLYTGLRVDEVAHLTVAQILSLASEMHKFPTQKEFPLLVVHTKGSDPALAMFPVQLIKALLKYIEGEREDVVEAATKRCSAPYVDPGILFLNGTQANTRDIGQPLTDQSISRIFSHAVSRCELFREETRFILDQEGSLVHHPETAEALTETVLRPAHTFHDLRHTFAVVQYAVRSLRGERNPLAAVRALLRHKLSQTTADIYLSWYHLHERHLSETLTAFLGDITNAAETTR